MIQSNQPTNGKTYWRSLGELQDTAEFRDFLHREFPVAASEFPEGVSRRRWLQLMGASLALGGLTGCRWEPEQIAPFAMRPENRIPGVPEQFATSIDIAGMPRHLLVTCYDGRPIKVEGNPEHPDSRGATDTFAQASILDLYDPDRSGALRETRKRKSFTRSWDEYDSFLEQHFAGYRATLGAGLGILVEPIRSLSEQALLVKIQERFPKLRLFQFSTLESHERTAAERVFGTPLRTSLRLNKAHRLLCLDADPLGIDATSVRNIGDFATLRTPNAQMSRLYAVESQFTVTGAAADHRLPLKSNDIGGFLSHIDAQIRNRLADPSAEPQSHDLPDTMARFAEAVVDDLLTHQQDSAIVVGARQPTAVHEMAFQLNQLLGNLGRAIELVRDADNLRWSDPAELAPLAKNGALKTLFVIGGNPVYDLPSDIPFRDVLDQIPTTIRCGQYDDETSAHCTWHVPVAHPFESWGDVQAWDGRPSITQPLIAPLLNGRSRVQLLAQCANDRREPQAIVRAAVDAYNHRNASSEDWKQWVHDGFVNDFPSPIAIDQLPTTSPPPPPIPFSSETDVELVFTASSTALDGRFANNGWLQETPDFLTKLTWDNAAIVSPQTATDLGLTHGKFARIEVREQQVEIPVYVMPGQARGSIGLAIGYGRTRSGIIGGQASEGIASVGVDVMPLRSIEAPFIGTATRVVPLDRTFEFATTQDHHAIDTVGREEIGQRVGKLVHEGPLDLYLEQPDFAHHGSHHIESDPLWQEPAYEGHAWGMAIDLNKCIGCNACTIACQAENNVPIVGKEQVALGREMHWLRIDRYFKGDVEEPEVTHQPVACHHCENAPCEQVCPVAATVHSDEGLNDMVYNRCVGTRYCANNCPYKVRRFNFLNYNEQLEEANRELVQLAVNPEVSVRSRGVMEKCTYCVQRIQNVKIDAKTGRRTIEDGEVKTACQQACPAQAIEFGDLNDPNSRVTQAHADARAYGMLAELNVKPRTKYLARIRNPHPLLADGRSPVSKDHADGHH